MESALSRLREEPGTDLPSFRRQAEHCRATARKRMQRAGVHCQFDGVTTNLISSRARNLPPMDEWTQLLLRTPDPDEDRAQLESFMADMHTLDDCRTVAVAVPVLRNLYIRVRQLERDHRAHVRLKHAEGSERPIM